MPLPQSTLDGYTVIQKKNFFKQHIHSFKFLLHQVVGVHWLQSGCLSRPSSNLLLLVSAWETS